MYRLERTPKRVIEIKTPSGFEKNPQNNEIKRPSAFEENAQNNNHF